jgi:hypothetical protein
LASNTGANISAPIPADMYFPGPPVKCVSVYVPPRN